MDTPIFKGDEVYPTEEPKNYSLARAATVINYVTLTTKFSPQFKPEKGKLVVDVNKNRVGTCVYKGFVKGKEGERCTIKGQRRNHHAALEDCAGIPPLGSFVQDENEVWHKLMNADVKGASVCKCFGPLKITEKSTSKKTKATKGAGKGTGKGAGKGKGKGKGKSTVTKEESVEKPTKSTSNPTSKTTTKKPVKKRVITVASDTDSTDSDSN